MSRACHWNHEHHNHILNEDREYLYRIVAGLWPPLFRASGLALCLESEESLKVREKFLLMKICKLNR
jgi:hypothetical protein